MTPKGKAKELVDKYYYLFSVELENTIDYRESKQCALIVVDELMKYAENSYYNKDLIKGAKLYFQEVKQEIENLDL